MNNSQNVLNRFRLFDGLHETSKVKIKDGIIWTTVSKENDVLSHKDTSNDVFLIAEGAVVARTYSKAGKEVNFAKLGRGEIFGEFSATDNQERSASISTTLDSVIGQMRGIDFRGLITKEPDFALRFCEHLVQKNRALSRRLFEFSALNVRQRICAELLRLAASRVEETDVLMIASMPTHQILANTLGTHREAVSREMSRLANCGVLEINGRRVDILNAQALRSIVGG